MKWEGGQECLSGRPVCCIGGRRGIRQGCVPEGLLPGSRNEAIHCTKKSPKGK
ncbi:hypothetical protein DESPIGER_1838 [Desulfovibrio piger]|uniref:Uncharacterized protein n=1 Tax=Desulfovibrio piger TaxID=901 RepID=A0A1K1LG57_9BACT|nr:hypothetical protein DESPIGER_1838 [Desulfovibrio piger]